MEGAILARLIIKKEKSRPRVGVSCGRDISKKGARNVLHISSGAFFVKVDDRKSDIPPKSPHSLGRDA
jgi:hypothetical protein